MARFRDERIDNPAWARDFESYRQFYNLPKWDNSLLPDAHPQVYPRLELARLFARGKVLDVGCNGGKFDFALARRGLDVRGVDISQLYITDNQRARLNEPPEVQARLHFQVLAAEEMQFVAEFDTVMIMEVLEHVLDPIDVMARLVRALKPDGIGLATVPIAGGLWEKAQEGLENEHLRRFTPDNLRTLLAETSSRAAVWAHPRNYLFGVFLGSDHPAAVQQMLNILPDGMMASHHLVDCLEALGEHRACYDVATRFVQRDPTNPSARLRLALHLHRTSQAPRALETIAPLVSNPACQTHAFYRLLGKILAACGQTTSSTEALTRAARLPRDESDWVATLWLV